MPAIVLGRFDSCRSSLGYRLLLLRLGSLLLLLRRRRWCRCRGRSGSERSEGVIRAERGRLRHERLWLLLLLHLLLISHLSLVLLLLESHVLLLGLLLGVSLLLLHLLSVHLFLLLLNDHH